MFEVYNPEKEKLNKEQIMQDFYESILEESADNFVQRVSLEKMKELKERGVTTEEFLDFICQRNNFLLHGSIHEISGNQLRSARNKIFASNKAAISIMRSIYSNSGVDLEYPYFLDEEGLSLKIHTTNDGNFIDKDKGYVYIVDNDGFENDPEGSWQFHKDVATVDFKLVFEIEREDFKYPVEVIEDLNDN